MNQREFTRVRTSFPVQVTLRVGVDGGDSPPLEPIAGTTRDVSLAGCFVSARTVPDLGTRCVAVLQLDAGSQEFEVAANGVVARVGPEGFAVHFEELLTLESYDNLKHVILYNAEDPESAQAELDAHLGLRRL